MITKAIWTYTCVFKFILQSYWSWPLTCFQITGWVCRPNAPTIPSTSAGRSWGHSATTSAGSRDSGKAWTNQAALPCGSGWIHVAMSIKLVNPLYATRFDMNQGTIQKHPLTRAIKQSRANLALRRFPRRTAALVRSPMISSLRRVVELEIQIHLGYKINHIIFLASWKTIS